jgi:hypothetical protein
MGAGDSRFSGGVEGGAARGGHGSGSLRVLLLVDRLRDAAELPDDLETSDVLARSLADVLSRLNPLQFSPRLGLWRELTVADRHALGHLPTHDRLGPDPRAGWGWRNMDAVRRLAALLRAEADVVLMAGSSSLRLWGTCAALIARCPRVVAIPDNDDTLHGPTARTADSPAGRHAREGGTLDRWVLRRASAVVTASQGQVEILGDLRGMARGGVHWIPRGVDTERFDFQAEGPFRVRRAYGLQADAPLVGLAGSIDARPQSAAELLNRLLEVNPAVRVVLLGSRTTAERVRPLLSEEHAACLLGPDGRERGITEPQQLAALQVLCWFADPDCDDLLLRQALACRVPAVLLPSDVQSAVLLPSDVQSAALLPSERRTGFGERASGHRRFPSRHAAGCAPRAGCVIVDQTVVGEPAIVDGAVAQVGELLADPGRAAELGRAGRDAVVRDGGMNEMVRRYERLLGEVVARSDVSSGSGDPPASGTLEVCPAT